MQLAEDKMAKDILVRTDVIKRIITKSQKNNTQFTAR